MKLTPAPAPTPSVAATVHPACTPEHMLCDDPNGSNISAFGIFIAVVVGLLILAAVTGKKSS